MIPLFKEAFHQRAKLQAGRGSSGHVGKSFPPAALSYRTAVRVHQESQPPTWTWKHFTHFGCWVPFQAISLWHHYVGKDPWKQGQHLPSARTPQGCTAHRLWTTTHPSVPSYTALLQHNFSPRTPASPRKITEVPETHRGAFRVSYKASWNHPAVNWALTFQAESSGSTEELAQNKGATKQVYGLRNLSKSKTTSFLDGLSQPDSVLSTWGFLCWLVVVFFFPLPVLKPLHIDRCFPYISILWCIKSCCWSSYKSFQGIISFIVTPGSSENLRGESSVLRWLCD